MFWQVLAGLGRLDSWTPGPAKVKDDFWAHLTSVQEGYRTKGRIEELTNSGPEELSRLHVTQDLRDCQDFKGLMNCTLRLSVAPEGAGGYNQLHCFSGS